MTAVVFFLYNEHKLVKFALKVILHAMDRSSSGIIFHQSYMHILSCPQEELKGDVLNA